MQIAVLASVDRVGLLAATVYNRMYHPHGYVRTDDGGAMAEYDVLVNRVILWNVAVERQIRVKGPDAEDFVNRVISRDATRIAPMRGKYTILCNEKSGILNDPVLLRPTEDEFWFSASDSDLMLWLQGVNVGLRHDVELAEIYVAPLQVQGPLSADLMADLVGEEVRSIPYCGLMWGRIGGCSVLVNQSCFSGENGYEVYVTDANVNAEAVWYEIRGHGARYGLRVIAPAHRRRNAAGILSWGQDMDAETSPFQVKLAHQVPRKKEADNVGKEALEAERDAIDAGWPPFRLKLVGLKMSGKPITHYAPDFWLIDMPDRDHVGYVMSPWWLPELDTNIALGYVPWEMQEIGTPFWWSCRLPIPSFRAGP